MSATITAQKGQIDTLTVKAESQENTITCLSTMINDMKEELDETRQQFKNLAEQVKLRCKSKRRKVKLGVGNANEDKYAMEKRRNGTA